eukprot:TRINITY_DN9768_c0_g2_i1.p1 TRINITY_DN9768_c0_g2~~TRINITY_DN9768_c0_g2_i1.p1  ORF type:complete len:131 (+),score=23.53 TRINITY_DN9768_c0_g2_i1:154-546(+)
MENKSLQDFLHKLLARIPGLTLVVVSDRDGVTLSKVARPDSKQQLDENALAATFSVTTDQASKLGLGANKTITSFFNDRVIVHINHLPVVVSLVGDSDVNIGAILALAPEIRSSLDPLKATLVNLNADAE